MHFTLKAFWPDLASVHFGGCTSADLAYSKTAAILLVSVSKEVVDPF